MASNDAPSALPNALKACRSSLASVAGFSLFINLLMLSPALYMLQVYDRVIPTRSGDTLLMLTLVVLFLFAVLGGLEMVRSRIMVRIGNRLDACLGHSLYRAIFRHGIRTAMQQSARPLDDLATLRQFLSGGGLFAFFDAAWVPVYLVVMFLFHVWLGVFACVAGAVLLALAVANEKATRRLMAEAESEQLEARQQADSNLRNAEVLHAMGMLPGIMLRWSARHRGYLLKQSRASDRAGVLSNLARTLRLLSQSLILGLGALLVLEGRMTPGMMIAGSLLLGRALAPVDQMIGSWKGFVGARDAYRRLDLLFAAAPAEPRRMSLPAPRGTLDIEGVSAGPPGASLPVLRGVSVRIERGEQVGIIGPSASGKSTLARIVLGVWPAQVGTVRLDGADIARWNRDELGPFLGYLPQDIELFDGTISDNIARFGDVDADRVVEAAGRAGVHDMILRLPEGYDTHLTARGQALSGGQRQRIGLARALYGNPVVVVLDEPNSNLDDSGERALGETLARLREEDVTLLVISHRTGVLRQVDKLLVLKEGRISLFGPRDRVLARLARPGTGAAPDRAAGEGPRPAGERAAAPARQHPEVRA
ncbi:type I secretion system permease/ATPase [Halomonas sp. LBP4]|uniref:type I secretion system permease/ATPase n=1 Tax=Halomonas sp. LBP4 TaxID=2044917 RepID=UPI000D773777|nr:type I secretion system permease/ATPase [Halomonas sp. LBP4]PXX97274.1 type I secretion system permease/ATPase [Halomonas sp. LBP4]